MSMDEFLDEREEIELDIEKLRAKGVAGPVEYKSALEKWKKRLRVPRMKGEILNDRNR